MYEHKIFFRRGSIPAVFCLSIISKSTVKLSPVNYQLPTRLSLTMQNYGIKKAPTNSSGPCGSNSGSSGTFSGTFMVTLVVNGLKDVLRDS